VVQPANRGSAIGILLPVPEILDRHPEARVLIPPSDHDFADEAALETAARMALDEIRHHGRGVALPRVAADEPDPVLGRIFVM
jgi:mannose-1-phosphate guanylyltransferase